MNSELTHIDDFLADSARGSAEPGDLQLWINSDQISFHKAELPDAPKSKWMNLLPWILEDELLMPVEDMHLVICAVDAERNASVIAIPKSEVFRLQMLVEAASIRVRSFLPDVLALPLEEGFITLAAVGRDRLLVRTGPFEGFSGDTKMVWQLLELRKSQDESLQLQCFGLEQESLPDWAEQCCQLSPNPVNWSFAETIPETNLLVGPFRAKSRTKLKPWYPSMGLAAMAIFLLCSLGLVDYLKNGRELEQINQLLMREFEAAFGVTASSPARIQSQGEQILREREQRFFSLVDSVMPITESLDPVLSNCSDCGLVSVQIEPDSATLVMAQGVDLSARLNDPDQFRISSSGANDQDQVVLNLQRRVQ